MLRALTKTQKMHCVIAIVVSILWQASNATTVVEKKAHPEKCDGILEDQRIDCGFRGITSSQCDSLGCCFMPTKNEEFPWCYYAGFKATTSAQPPTTKPVPDWIQALMYMSRKIITKKPKPSAVQASPSTITIPLSSRLSTQLQDELLCQRTYKLYKKLKGADKCQAPLDAREACVEKLIKKETESECTACTKLNCCYDPVTREINGKTMPHCFKTIRTTTPPPPTTTSSSSMSTIAFSTRPTKVWSGIRPEFQPGKNPSLFLSPSGNNSTSRLFQLFNNRHPDISPVGSMPKWVPSRHNGTNSNFGSGGLSLGNWQGTASNPSLNLLNLLKLNNQQFQAAAVSSLGQPNRSGLNRLRPTDNALRLPSVIRWLQNRLNPLTSTSNGAGNGLSTLMRPPNGVHNSDFASSLSETKTRKPGQGDRPSLMKQLMSAYRPSSVSNPSALAKTLSMLTGNSKQQVPALLPTTQTNTLSNAFEQFPKSLKLPSYAGLATPLVASLLKKISAAGLATSSVRELLADRLLASQSPAKLVSLLLAMLHGATTPAPSTTTPAPGTTTPHPATGVLFASPSSGIPTNFEIENRPLPPRTCYPEHCGHRTVDDQITQRIVGGQWAGGVEHWPWMASLRRTFLNDDRFIHICGACVISKRWIVTAGHCFIAYKKRGVKIPGRREIYPSVYSIHVGKYYRESPELTMQVFEIKTYEAHPLYDFRSLKHDIAVAKLKEPMMFSSSVQPACLPSKHDALSPLDMAWITGWGDTLKVGKHNKSKLKELTLPLISNAKCEKSWPGHFHEAWICTEGAYLEDACAGDSGGPLVKQGQNKRWSLIGIAIAGTRSCSTVKRDVKPGIYTKLAYYRDFIDVATRGACEGNVTVS